MVAKQYSLKVVHKPSHIARSEKWFNTEAERTAAIEPSSDVPAELALYENAHDEGDHFLVCKCNPGRRSGFYGTRTWTCRRSRRADLRYRAGRKHLLFLR
jgi:hypothetical protein